MKPKLIITVIGGLVQQVVCTQPVDVDIVVIDVNHKRPDPTLVKELNSGDRRVFDFAQNSKPKHNIDFDQIWV